MNWKGRRVFITGAGGFIGSHLVKRLVTEGALVNVLIKKNDSPWRIREVIDRITVQKADLTDLDSLHPIIAHTAPQVIFHLAAQVDVSRSWDLIMPMVRNNTIGTINLLTVLKQFPYEAFIYTSSSGEYGDAGPSPLKEEQREFPVSPYSFSKVTSTFFCQMAARTYEMPVIILRLFPTYGPYQEGSMFIPSAIKDLLLKKTFKMTPGEQKREFNYVDDVVDAYLRVAACGKAQGEIINVGSGIAYNLKDVAVMIQELVGGDTTVDIGALPYRKGEGMECYCNNEKLQRLTGWSPKVSLEEGLRLTVEWYRSYYAREGI